MSNLYSEVAGAIPIAPMIKPRHAATKPFAILEPVRVPTIEIPNIASINISPVPNANMIGLAI